ncbi:MAG: hypothetical protein ACRD92_01880 [Nitrosopumilaceae archaeon]
MENQAAILKVEDAYAEDIGKGKLRIDFDSMDSIGASTGDLIEINGARKTQAVCYAVRPEDGNKGILLTDYLVQHNAGIFSGDKVTIQKANKAITEYVTLFPLQPIKKIAELYFKEALDGVPVTKGDTIMIPSFGEELLFQVVVAIPAGVVSNEKTRFSISEKS